VPHCFIYMWRHGVQCHGVDGRPGESFFWRDVMACPVSVQERLRGWLCRVTRSVAACMLIQGCR
jgi:hypothetical protein